MQSYEIPAHEAKKLREFLRSQLRTSPFGLHFSETGKLNLCRRFGLTINELETLIEQIRAEAAFK
jgi:hypothetical protein